MFETPEMVFVGTKDIFILTLLHADHSRSSNSFFTFASSTSNFLSMIQSCLTSQILLLNDFTILGFSWALNEHFSSNFCLNRKETNKNLLK